MDEAYGKTKRKLDDLNAEDKTIEVLMRIEML